MAVAEKKAQEISTSSLLDRVPVVSLVGVVYVLACLGILFKLVPDRLAPDLGQFHLVHVGDPAGGGHAGCDRRAGHPW